MAKRVKIPGRLESAETGNIVTGADAVMDDAKGKTQVVINSEVDAAIISLAQGKQDALTFDSAPTEDSPNPVTSAGVYTADKVLSDAIEAILLLIPSAASALNKLVDMQTMNSSIATATASFKGTYNLVSDLHLGVDATHEQIGAALDALSLGADNNDYAFVQVPNSATAPTEVSKTERYKFNGANWLFEYDLNNSGFTQGQWNAINSGVTSLLVGKLSDLPTNAELTTLLAGKQDNLTFDNVPTAGSPNPVKSGGVYARNNEIVALINALDAAKQDVLTFDNAPVEGSPNPVKSGGVYTAISAVQAAIVALDAAKQNVLTFDSTPTLGSLNPVTSSGIKTELDRIDGNVTTLNDLYEALTQSALVIVEPSDTWPVTSPASKTIYRVVDRVNTPPQYYSDYMWNGTAMVLMATYDNAIDTEINLSSRNNIPNSKAVKDYVRSMTYDGKAAFCPLDILEVGNIYIGTNGWNYNDGTDFYKRVRVKQGCEFNLKPGDTIKLTDYSDARFYVGWRRADGTYGTGGWWRTSDYKCTEEGEYVVLLSNITPVETSVAALGSLLRIVNQGAKVVADRAKSYLYFSAGKQPTITWNGSGGTGSHYSVTIPENVELRLISDFDGVLKIYPFSDETTYDIPNYHSLVWNISTNTIYVKDSYSGSTSDEFTLLMVAGSENATGLLMDYYLSSITRPVPSLEDVVYKGGQWSSTQHLTGVGAVVNINSGNVVVPKGSIIKFSISDPGNILKTDIWPSLILNGDIYIGCKPNNFVYITLNDDYSVFHTWTGVSAQTGNEGDVTYTVEIVSLYTRIAEIEERADRTSILYWNNEVEFTGKILQLPNAKLLEPNVRGNKPLVLVHTTDMHGDNPSIKRAIDFYNAYSQYIDDVIHTGDNQQFYYDQDSGGSFGFGSIPGAEKVLNVIGNHDVWLKEGGKCTEQQAYDKYFSDFIANWGLYSYQSGKCYYTKDYQESNIRLIVLDSMNWGSTQKVWLEDALSDAKNSGRAVICVSHHIPDSTGANNIVRPSCAFNTLEENIGDAAYLDSEAADVVQDFIDNNGEFICWMCGHTHKDVLGTLTNYPDQFVYTIEQTWCVDYYGGCNRIKNTRTQDLFNVMAFDATSKVIKFVRVGANYDRFGRHINTLCYDYAQKRIVQ